MAGAVERGNQRRQLVFRHILEFVDEKFECRLTFVRGIAEGCKEIREIGVEVAAVGQPNLRVVIYPDFQVLIICPESTEETRQRPHGSLCIVLERLAAAQAQESRQQCRSEQCW